MKKLSSTLLFILIFLNFYSQENPCLPILEDGLYKYVIKTRTSTFNSDLKSYFESDTFKEDFKSGKWKLGVDGIIPFGDNGMMQKVGIDFGASEDKINEFQKHVKDAKSIQIDDKFYQSSVTAVPDVGLARAYVDCIPDIESYGFQIKNVIETPKNVVFNVSYSKRLSSDPMPAIKDFKIVGSNKIIQGLSVGEKISDEFSISCERYPENELILSINTDRENLVHVVEASEIGFGKEFPIGSVITSMLDWNSFSQITDDKSSSEWDAGKSKWVPADGRNVSASKYTRKSGKSSVPDLRGVFLRGLNRFDPFYTKQVPEKQKDIDGINRDVGSFQGDQIESHSHKFSYTTSQNEASNGGAEKHKVSDKNINREGITVNSGGTETRPKNIAVYYYVRIN